MNFFYRLWLRLPLKRPDSRLLRAIFRGFYRLRLKAPGAVFTNILSQFQLWLRLPLKRPCSRLWLSNTHCNGDNNYRMPIKTRNYSRPFLNSESKADIFTNFQNQVPILSYTLCLTLNFTLKKNALLFLIYFFYFYDKFSCYKIDILTFIAVSRFPHLSSLKWAIFLTLKSCK